MTSELGERYEALGKEVTDARKRLHMMEYELARMEWELVWEQIEEASEAKS